MKNIYQVYFKQSSLAKNALKISDINALISNLSSEKAYTTLKEYEEDVLYAAKINYEFLRAPKSDVQIQRAKSIFQHEYLKLASDERFGKINPNLLPNIISNSTGSPVIQQLSKHYGFDMDNRKLVGELIEQYSLTKFAERQKNLRTLARYGLRTAVITFVIGNLVVLYYYLEYDINLYSPRVGPYQVYRFR